VWCIRVALLSISQIRRLNSSANGWAVLRPVRSCSGSKKAGKGLHTLQMYPQLDYSLPGCCSEETICDLEPAADFTSRAHPSLETPDGS
jgi:hypothetical protein